MSVKLLIFLVVQELGHHEAPRPAKNFDTGVSGILGLMHIANRRIDDDPKMLAI